MLACCTRFSPRIRQTFVAFGPILITVSLGMTEGFSAILLPKLNVSQALSSWIASIAALPMALGCILGGLLMEKIGRKATHILACFPCVLGWLIIYFSDQDTNYILTGRFITGFCVGLLGPPTGVYMSETAEPTFRGFLLASISFAIAFGLFLSHLLGTYFSWQNTCLASCAFPVVAALTMLVTPESPTWLIKVGKVKRGREAFVWCRGEADDTLKELDILVERQKALNEIEVSFVQTFKEMKRPEFYKPLVIIVCFFVACQWAGLNAITFYSITILEGTLSSFDPYAAMLIIDAIRVVASLAACLLLKKIGRRPLALLSGCGTFVSLFVLSFYTFYVKNWQVEPEVVAKLNFVPLSALVAYVTFITIGFVPLPWTLMGEMFPLASRGVGSGISSLSAYLAFFSVVKTTPGMFGALGAEGTFLVFGVVGLVGTVQLYVYLPETKDKPLYQIEDYFKSNKSANN